MHKAKLTKEEIAADVAASSHRDFTEDTKIRFDEELKIMTVILNSYAKLSVAGKLWIKSKLQNI